MEINLYHDLVYMENHDVLYELLTRSGLFYFVLLGSALGRALDTCSQGSEFQFLPVECSQVPFTSEGNC
jgi:hypothetical protein